MGNFQNKTLFIVIIFYARHGSISETFQQPHATSPLNCVLQTGTGSCKVLLCYGTIF